MALVSLSSIPYTQAATMLSKNVANLLNIIVHRNLSRYKQFLTLSLQFEFYGEYSGNF